MAHILEQDRTWLLTHAEEALPSAPAKKFETLVRRRETHEPIAYIVGHKDFYGRRFNVNKNVLIPRPETELVIDEVKRSVGHDHNGSGSVIWDIGTGSGAIGVTLACELPHAQVLATDVSTRALAVATKNARSFRASNVMFLKSDLLQRPAYLFLEEAAKSSTQLFVCANLPYLPESDKKKLDKDVVDFEPARALFAQDEGLALIEQLLGQLARHVAEWKFTKTTILFEFDPPQADALRNIASKLFPRAKIVIQKDLAERERLLKIELS